MIQAVFSTLGRAGVRGSEKLAMQQNDEDATAGVGCVSAHVHDFAAVAVSCRPMILWAILMMRWRAFLLSEVQPE